MDDGREPIVARGASSDVAALAIRGAEGSVGSSADLHWEIDHGRLQQGQKEIRGLPRSWSYNIRLRVGSGQAFVSRQPRIAGAHRLGSLLRGNPLCDTPPTAPAFGQSRGRSTVYSAHCTNIYDEIEEYWRPAHADTHRKSLAQALEVSHVKRANDVRAAGSVRCTWVASPS